MPPSAQDGLVVGLFQADRFEGFGPSQFRPPCEPMQGHCLKSRSQAKLRLGVREHAPRWPGVYAMLDSRGRIVYIGKAKNLRVRLMSYFRKQSRDPKAGKILRHTRTLVWEQVPDEFGALLRELELIRRFRPRFNVLGQPGRRRYFYLCLGKTPAPHVYATYEPAKKDLAIYGPLVGRSRTDEAARRLNDYYQLRDCPSRVTLSFADQPELFPDDRSPRCLRHDIGTCLGPCAGLCSRTVYGANVRLAKTFLDGKSKAVLHDLQTRMTAASEGLRFEQAMALRDRFQSLTWLDKRLNFLRSARKGGSGVYPLTGADGRIVWYLIHRGEVRAAVREPHDDESFKVANATIDGVFATERGPVTDRTVDSVLLVSGWFRKHPEEKTKLLGRKVVLTRVPQPA